MTRKVHESMHREDKVQKALVSWGDLNRLIGDMDEEDVMHALRVELATERRKSFVKRLTQRLHGIKMAETLKLVEEVTQEVRIDGSARRDRRRN